MSAALRRALALGLATLSSAGMAAGPQLYGSGPGVDAAYVRFVNTTERPIDIVSAGNNGGRLHIEPASPASAFQPVRPKSPIAGRVSQGSATVDVSTTAAPGELVTVVVWDKGGQSLGTTVLADLPKNFNALKSTLAFYNFDAQCPLAGLNASGRDAIILEGTGPQSVRQRAVNPVVLSTQAMCGAVRAGPAMDMKALEAGQRYSVFLASGEKGRRAFWVRDEL